MCILCIFSLVTEFHFVFVGIAGSPPLRLSSLPIPLLDSEVGETVHILPFTQKYPYNPFYIPDGSKRG